MIRCSLHSQVVHQACFPAERQSLEQNIVLTAHPFLNPLRNSRKRDKVVADLFCGAQFLQKWFFFMEWFLRPRNSNRFYQVDSDI